MRSYYRKKLNKMLGAASNEEFIQLLWATHALQSDYAHAAKKFIQPETIPDGAITTEITSQFFIQKWEIETLANELMTVPKSRSDKNGQTRRFPCDDYRMSSCCVNWLRDLENVEYSIQKKRQDFSIEMGRIVARQSGWQRGYANMSQFYRNAFVYGQGECAAYFEKKHGITFNRFSQIGFMLFVSFTSFPVVRNDASWAKFGVTKDEIERVLELIAMPYAQAAKQAKVSRKKIIHTADKPSILRQSPCLRFGQQGERIRAPLPELILERVTSGVFYDVVGGGGPVRDDYGKRFEEYCHAYLSKTLTKFEWERESSYRKKPNLYSTPDILCGDTGELKFVFECKATRMSQEAMFGKDPMAARGYQDMIKAVFQLWRFFSHCRRGYTGRKISETIVGVVLTLDNWLLMSESLRKKVLEEAAKLAGEKDPQIIKEDQKPIVFVAIPELERTLSVATEVTFKEALLKANSENYIGWRLDSIHTDLFGDSEPENRQYLFTDQLSKLLPWWEELADNKKA